jgi:hypothetical protein
MENVQIVDTEYVAGRIRYVRSVPIRTACEVRIKTCKTGGFRTIEAEDSGLQG